MSRIEHHPIVRVDRGIPFTFGFADRRVEAFAGETIASALYGAGIRVFGHHPKDGAPQGIYCANGQCAQCLVLVDGIPVKACMTPAAPGIHVEPLDGLPELPQVERIPELTDIDTIRIPVLILGGGPAGLSAAIELGERGIETLLVDDKDRLGGKLVLQTHRFFGSSTAVYAGTRGIDIAGRLEQRVRTCRAIDVWTNSTALAVFSDRKVGVLKDGRYVLVEPQHLLVTTGARERSLVFDGNTLPGVYGAGAFQTLVNRDLVRAAERLFIVGGGNVGLIAGYHALQAGIDVVGLVEALPDCGGYRVHRDKLARMGVPIYTSHTVVGAHGADRVEAVTIARVDGRFRPIEGTERSFGCDTLLIAVGLDPVDEFTEAAERFGLPVHAAGDAEEIAEASAAIFSGRIRGREIACDLGVADEPVPEDWHRMAAVLKSRPGAPIEGSPTEPSASPPRASAVRFEGVRPIFHCHQEIPCDPCTTVCPRQLIRLEGEDIRSLPRLIPLEDVSACVGCERCVAVCPGLAITLVDGREEATQPLVTVPFELGPDRLRVEGSVEALDVEGGCLGTYPIVDIRALPTHDRTVLVRLRAPADVAPRIAGVRVQEPAIGAPLAEAVAPLHDRDIVCRCERVTAGELRALIRAGLRDVNEIKAVSRAGMGACGGKTCRSLIHRLFREEGVSLDEVTDHVHRPLFVEVPLGVFAGWARSADGGPSAPVTDDGGAPAEEQLA